MVHVKQKLSAYPIGLDLLAVIPYGAAESNDRFGVDVKADPQPTAIGRQDVSVHNGSKDFVKMFSNVDVICMSEAAES